MIICGSFVFILFYLTSNSHVIAHVIPINDHSWIIRGSFVFICVYLTYNSHVIAHVILINDHSWVIRVHSCSFAFI